uniref:Uncharacterized protein n=1 Tax=Brassica oleracea var. oleracea TaxID=109376 RepID=A0A0D3DQC5_BRAOL
MATEFNLPVFQFDLRFLFFVSVSVSMASFLNPNSYDVLKKLDQHLLSHLVSPLTGTIVPRIILVFAALAVSDSNGFNSDLDVYCCLSCAPCFLSNFKHPIRSHVRGSYALRVQSKGRSRGFLSNKLLHSYITGILGIQRVTHILDFTESKIL